MKSSKIILYTIILVLVIISSYTFYKIITNHNEKLMYVLDSKIEYYAKRCYLEDKCENKLTIQDLYDKGYIKSELVNPVSKEIIDAKTSITIDKDNKVTINWN